MNTKKYLCCVADKLWDSCDPNKPFWYLSAPMAKYPQFNIPAIDSAAAILRMNGYNVASPADIAGGVVKAECLKSEKGLYSEIEGDWNKFVAIGLIITALPNCIGGIFLDGWEDSYGCSLEAQVLKELKKQLQYFSAKGTVLEQPQLTLFDALPPLSNAGCVCYV